MKEQDPKQRFLLIMAVGLTFLLILQYMNPAPEPPPAATGIQHADVPASQQARPAARAESDAPLPSRDFQASGDFAITVKTDPEGKGTHGYEASFSTVGGGMSSYRLLGYYRKPGNVSPDNRIVLLHTMAQGRDSLRVDNVIYGASRQELYSIAMSEVRYELLEVPAGAVVTPEPGAEVKRGDNLRMRTVAGDWELTRTYRFPGEDKSQADFTIALDLEWRNLSDGNRILNYSVVGPAGLIPDDESMQFGQIEFLTARQPSAGSAAVDIERKHMRDLIKVEKMRDRDNRAGLAWIGAKSRFFASVMATADSALSDSNGATRLLYPGDPAFIATVGEAANDLANQPTVTTAAGTVPAFEEISLTVEPAPLPPGGSYAAGYVLYAGPGVDRFMTDADARFEGVVYYSWGYLNVLSLWMVRLLNFLDGFLGNYGLAIIAMTVIIKLLLHSLNRRSFISMNKMSKLQPMMKDIQKKYANDRQKMQVEMNKFYKQNGVSMMGGCLPMFLQLPIFFALYGAFSQGFAMRHAPFLAPWIKDLSKPDSIYDFGYNIPILNSSHLSLLPILYFVLQYIQMSLQPKPSDPQQAQQQKIMKFMPLMFVFIFYAMPAGLVLYFTVSALCGVAENTYMKKIVLPKLGLGDAPSPAAAAAGVQAGTGAAAVPSEAGKKKKKK